MSEKVTVTDAAFPEVTIADVTYVLTPSLGAVRKIVQGTGGLKTALSRVIAVDVDAIAGVIMAGAGLTFEDKKSADAFVEKVFAEKPLSKAMEATGMYLSLMLNGGRAKQNDDGVSADEAGATAAETADAGNA